VIGRPIIKSDDEKANIIAKAVLKRAPKLWQKTATI